MLNLVFNLFLTLLKQLEMCIQKGIFHLLGESEKCPRTTEATWFHHLCRWPTLASFISLCQWLHWELVTVMSHNLKHTSPTTRLCSEDNLCIPDLHTMTDVCQGHTSRKALFKHVSGRNRSFCVLVSVICLNLSCTISWPLFLLRPGFSVHCRCLCLVLL